MSDYGVYKSLLMHTQLYSGSLKEANVHLQLLKKHRKIRGYVPLASTK